MSLVANWLANTYEFNSHVSIVYLISWNFSLLKTFGLGLFCLSIFYLDKWVADGIFCPNLFLSLKSIIRETNSYPNIQVFLLLIKTSFMIMTHYLIILDGFTKTRHAMTITHPGKQFFKNCSKTIPYEKFRQYSAG